jgi:CheY-like chemotaxis protein
MDPKKVMIIDDDPDFLEELNETLSLTGYETLPVLNSIQALEMVRRKGPDIILLDLRMGGKSGYEVADELSRHPETAHIPIITMTGYFGEKEFLKLSRMKNIKSHLSKPFFPLDVIFQVETTV